MALFDRLAERAEAKARAAADATLRSAEAVFAAIPDVRLRRAKGSDGLGHACFLRRVNCAHGRIAALTQIK